MLLCFLLILGLHHRIREWFGLKGALQILKFCAVGRDLFMLQSGCSLSNLPTQAIVLFIRTGDTTTAHFKIS